LNASETDVLYGKGMPLDQHPGNIIFRKLVHSNKQLYDSCPNSEKHIVGQTIFDTLVRQEPPVRFLERQSHIDGNRWVTLPRAKVIRKIAKALREHGSSHGRENNGGIFHQSRTGKRNRVDNKVENENKSVLNGKHSKKKRMKSNDDTSEEPTNDEAWDWLITNLKPLLPFSARNPKPDIIESTSSNIPLDKSCSKLSDKHTNDKIKETRTRCTVPPLHGSSLVRIVSNEHKTEMTSETKCKKNDNCDASINSLNTIEDSSMLGSPGDNPLFNDSASYFRNTISADDKKEREWTPPEIIVIENTPDKEDIHCDNANNISDDEISIPETTGEFAKVLEQVKYNARYVTDEEESQQSYDSCMSTTIIDIY